MWSETWWARGLIVLAAQGAWAQEPSGLRAVAGAVVDGNRQPLPGAAVHAIQGHDTLPGTRTGPDGAYRLAGLSAGRATIVARRLGFRERGVEIEVLADRAVTPLDIALEQIPVELSATEVSDRSPELRLRLREFYERRASRRRGHFFDTAEIDAARAQYVSDVLRQVPGVRLAASNQIGSTIRIRGCRPLVWLDGVRLPDAEVDEVIRPSDVAGIEVYLLGQIPPQYADRAYPCGSILIWTR